MANKYQRLLNNTFLFLLAQAGSKIIALVLIPIYSHVFSAEEYGLIDGITAGVSLLLPIVTLMIQTAVLRFVLDKEEDPKIIFSNSIAIYVVEMIVILSCYIALKILNIYNGILEFIALSLALEALNGILINYVKARNKNVLFMMQGFICTFVMGTLNILFLCVFHMGIQGYFFSIALAYLVTNIVIIIWSGCLKDVSISAIDKQKLKKMLAYCIPMIANSLSWTLMSIGDRYMIIALLGLSANGIYAIATKIPTMISSLTNIFQQSWEISAIEEQKSEDKNGFYTIIFDYMSTFMVVCVSGCMIIIRIVIEQFLGDGFVSAWRYTPFLLLSLLFSSYASFYGASYNAEKKTMGAFLTSMAGAVINILLNYFLIKIGGLQGATIATMIAYLIMWLIRLFHTRAYIKINIPKIRFIISWVVLGAQVAVFYLLSNYWLWQMFAMSGFAVLLILLNKSVFFKMIQSLQKKFKREKSK